MLSLFAEEFRLALPDYAGKSARPFTIATGTAAAPLLQELLDEARAVCHNLEYQIIAVRNDFLGEGVSVAGLITGQDLTGQLLELKKGGFDLGETLLVSANMFRTGERVFLDDMTQEEAEEALGVCITPVDSSGKDFVNALIDRDYSMGRVNDRFVYLDGKAF